MEEGKSKGLQLGGLATLGAAFGAVAICCWRTGDWSTGNPSSGG